MRKNQQLIFFHSRGIKQKTTGGRIPLSPPPLQTLLTPVSLGLNYHLHFYLVNGLWIRQ